MLEKGIVMCVLFWGRFTAIHQRYLIDLNKTVAAFMWCHTKSSSRFRIARHRGQPCSRCRSLRWVRDFCMANVSPWGLVEEERGSVVAASDGYHNRGSKEVYPMP
jgi:hypothetical protein